MEVIGQKAIWAFLDGRGCQESRCRRIREDEGHEVGSYLDLATKVAELQFRNPDHVLMFRGQPCDYRDGDGLTTLKPTLFRPTPEEPRYPFPGTLDNRFNRLKVAERLLLDSWTDPLGLDRLRKYRLLRWAILQHYEVCPTPLLDVTHSLRIAASFASIARGDAMSDEAFLYVLGVPNLSGAVTASAEAGLQIVRLSSVCPPTAVRPHIQEGYLVGEYPDMPDFAQKRYYGQKEIDFGRRLITKFRFTPREFWSDRDFPRLSHRALYPAPAADPLAVLAKEITDYFG